MSYDPSQVAFVDTETTGLDPELHHVWEVAVIVDGQEHVWQEYLWMPSQTEPDWSAVDPWVVENTGIRERYDHANAVTWQDTAIRFNKLTRGRHLVGACPWFDSERLHRNWLRYCDLWAPWETDGPDRALPWHYHLIDIETLIIGYMRGQYSDEPDYEGPTKADLPWSSEDLSRFVGVDPDDFKPRHTALTDARWAKACFEAVMGTPT